MSWSQLDSQIIKPNDSTSAYGELVVTNGSGNRIAVNDVTYNNENGRVQIYHLGESSWELIGEINGTTSNGYVGEIIVMSEDGNRIAITNENNQVLVYDYNAPLDWTLVGTINDDYAKFNLILSGDYLAYNNNNSQIKTFKYQAQNDWLDLGIINVNSRSICFDASGTRLAVGIPVHNIVRIYEYSETGWIPYGDDIIGPLGATSFGIVVALDGSGTTIAVQYRVPETAGKIEEYKSVPGHGATLYKFLI